LTLYDLKGGQPEAVPFFIAANIDFKGGEAYYVLD
jgi:hypothetical protein